MKFSVAFLAAALCTLGLVVATPVDAELYKDDSHGSHEGNRNHDHGGWHGGRGGHNNDDRSDCRPAKEDAQTQLCREAQLFSTPFNHFRSGMDYFTASEADGDFIVKTWGYHKVGATGRLLSKPLKGTKALFRIYGGWHLYTTDTAEVYKVVSNPKWVQGYGGVVGYVFENQVCGAVALWRRKVRATSRETLTVNEEEHKAAIESGASIDQGILGWVMPN